MTKKDKKAAEKIIKEISEFFDSYKITIGKLIDVPVDKIDVSTFADGLSMIISSIYEESLPNTSMFDSNEVVLFRTKLTQLLTLQLLDFDTYSKLIKEYPIILNFIGIMFHIEGETLDKLYRKNN